MVLGAMLPVTVVWNNEWKVSVTVTLYIGQCDAVQFGTLVIMLRRSLLPPRVWASQTWVPSYQTERCHSPQDYNRILIFTSTTNQVTILNKSSEDIFKMSSPRMAGNIWKKDATFFLLQYEEIYLNSCFFKQHRNNEIRIISFFIYEGWNFNSGNYLFTTDTK